MKNKWTALVICAAAVILAVWLGNLFAPPHKDPNDPYIYDGANALSESVRQEIRDLNVGAERKVYVLCVSGTGRYSLKKFAEITARDC